MFKDKMDHEEFLKRKLDIAHYDIQDDQKAALAERLAMNMADPLIPSHIDFLYRDDWLAFPPVHRQPMRVPVRYIRLVQSGGKSCVDRDDCIIRVRKLQETHVITDGLEDISYNFLIDHEGRVYEGRGWHVRAQRPPKYLHLHDNGVDICILGSWKREPIPEVTMKILGDLIKYGVEANLIKEKYILLGCKDVDEVQEEMKRRQKDKDLRIKKEKTKPMME